MHGRIALSLFGFVAVFGILLVNVTDPYAGATASPYYMTSTSRLSVEAQQLLQVETAAYEAEQITRDNFTVTEKPKPPPPPPPPAVEEESSSSSGGGGGYSAPVAVASPGSAQAIAAEMLAARGFGSDQFDCLVALWNKESGWRVNAANPSSGAYGIPQALPGSKMASSGADWQTNAATQIHWGLGYIQGRYGSPCGAWGHSVDVGWY
ncbi:lytic transglycosylase domain-containing protein [Naasia sp. SYSU D00057]|uniref:aggregation-promoting factor C-terminal-like domain-containing protein n=1 Tax=Naasia sp. SYSU D00057 TaxID=2817380 RepID=UPI001B3078E8|nr:lytic transglycosylase domain-containing protein [Naasia sp. SYSU D00057]